MRENFTHEAVPRRGTTKPFSWLKPRRNRNRERLKPSAETLLRIEHAEWVTARMMETTTHKNHWDDPRWDEDELPTGWSYEEWLASRRRSGTL